MSYFKPTPAPIKCNKKEPRLSRKDKKKLKLAFGVASYDTWRRKQRKINFLRHRGVYIREVDFSRVVNSNGLYEL